MDLGLKPQDRVGVIGSNCPEWMLTMQGCNRTRYRDAGREGRRAHRRTGRLENRAGRQALAGAQAAG